MGIMQLVIIFVILESHPLKEFCEKIQNEGRGEGSARSHFLKIGIGLCLLFFVGRLL